MRDDEGDLDELGRIAEEAARAAAAELRARFGRRQPALRAKSTPTDPVSEADLAAEAAIRDVLLARRPGDAILGEEGGETGPGDDPSGGRGVNRDPGVTARRWVVDPLDGTVNFLYGVPQFAVSVACEDGDGGLVGVVLDPVRDECFAAVRNGVATLDGEPIHGSTRAVLDRALVATGFGYDPAVRARQAAVAARVLPRARDVRRAGAAALDLCWTACGRYDAYYERGVKPWDVAAGALIAERAGLAVRTLAEADGDPAGVVVAPPGLIDELYRLVA